MYNHVIPIGDSELKKWIQAVASPDPFPPAAATEDAQQQQQPAVDPSSSSLVGTLWRAIEFFRTKYSLPLDPASSDVERLATEAKREAYLAQMAPPPASARVMREDEDGHMVMMDVDEGDWDDDYRPSFIDGEMQPFGMKPGRGGGRGRGRGRGGPGGGGAIVTAPPPGGSGMYRGRGRWGRGRWSSAAAAAGSSHHDMYQGSGSLASLSGLTGDNNNVNGIGGGEGSHGNLSYMQRQASGSSAPIAAYVNAIEPETETLEEVEKRMNPGSIKHHVLTLLKEAGEEGLSVNELVDEIQKREWKNWEEPKQARNSVASTCGLDKAFIRVGPAKFALKSLLPPDKLKALLAETLMYNPGSLSAAGGSYDKAIAAVDAAHAEAICQLNAVLVKKQTENNNFNCAHCKRVVHPTLSPLLLCDTCPRSIHLECLGVGWDQLPTGVWCCPWCMENVQAAYLRVKDLEARRNELMERAERKDREAEDKLLKRLLGKDDKDKLHTQDGDKLPIGKRSRAALDDMEIIEEEKENAVRLKARLVELQEMAAKSGPEGGGGAQSIQHQQQQQQKMQASSSFQQLPQQGDVGNGDGVGSLTPIGGGGGDFLEDAAVRAEETKQAIEKLEIIIKGPPTYPPLFENDPTGTTEATFMEALSVTEFLALYDEACETRKTLSTFDIMEAAAWPLDAEEMAPLYQQLLLCCILEQLNRDPPAKSIANRWWKLMTNATWPEILRRYLLRTRNGLGPGGVELNKHHVTDTHGNGADDDEAGDEDAGGSGGSGSSSSERGRPAPPHDMNPLEMDMDQIALHAADVLQTESWWTLRPIVHLKLLHLLCYDIAQGYNLRQEIQGRLNESITIHTERFRLHFRRGTGRGGGAAGGGATRGKKKKRGGGAATGPSTSGGGGGEQGEAELQALEAEAAAAEEEAGGGEADNEEEEEEDAEKVAARFAQDAEFEAKLVEKAFRTEALGLDRHFNKYWALACDPGFIFVENDQGRITGVMRSVAELDELIAGLIRTGGQREKELYITLRRRYKMLTEMLSKKPEEQLPTLQLDKVPRPPPADKRKNQPNIKTLGQAVNQASMTEVKTRLEGFINELQDAEIKLPEWAETKELRRRVRVCDTPQDVAECLIFIESALGVAGEGLPGGGSNAGIAHLLEEDALPFDEEEAKRLAEEENQKLAAAAAAAVKDEDEDEEDEEDEEDDEEEEGAAAAGGGPGRRGKRKNKEGETAPLRHVVRDDEFDDSDAEHAYLREKRMRKPARLWRTPRERAVWVKSVKQAVKAGGAAAVQVTYCAYLLVVRANPMLERIVALAKEHAKWEEEEKMRVAEEAEAAKNRPPPDPKATEEGYPLMIRTGKAKTDDGVKFVLKAMGREPFPEGRKVLPEHLEANEKMVKECKWGYQCTVCQQTGDLMCCEHPDGCNFTAHLRCTVLVGLPKGSYICPNHDEADLKTRKRKRTSGFEGMAGGYGELSEDDDDESGEEGGSEDGKKKKKKGGGSDEEEEEKGSEGSDSETVTESDDSE